MDGGRRQNRGGWSIGRGRTSSGSGRWNTRDLVQNWLQTIAKLRNSVTQLKQVGNRDVSGEAESVAIGVEVAVENCGLLSTKRQGDRLQIKATSGSGSLHGGQRNPR